MRLFTCSDVVKLK